MTELNSKEDVETIKINNFKQVAEDYMRRGFAVIPLEAGGKKPYNGYGWGKKSLAQDELDNISSVANIGVVLGERSGGLIDLDFDCQEAAIMGAYLFPDLPSFGRKSSPNSHRVVMCPDASKTLQFKLAPAEAEALGLKDTEKSVVLEIRGNGGYTMFPPSHHPSGEMVKWTQDLPESIPVMAWSEIVKKAELVAFLAVILRMYPTSAGNRDGICMALAGTLLRASLTVEEADNLVCYVAECKGDEEAQKRRKAQGTYEKLSAGEDVTGLPALCDMLGIPALKNTLHKWLYGSLPQQETTEKELALLNASFFVVENEGGKCRVCFFEARYFEKGQTRDVLCLQSFPDFKNRFMHKLVFVGVQNGKEIYKSLGDYWLKHPKRRQYERIEFIPGGEVPVYILNLWRGFVCRPKKGSWKKMLRHVWKVLAKKDKAAFRYIVFWAAWAVQNPAEPAEVALVFRGGKGTGKGTFCRWLKNLFGQHGLQIFSPKHITGRFNSHFRDCVLLFADEAIAPNDQEAEGVLKGIITEPSLPIEGKGRDIIQVPNHLHVLMASNADWVIPASADERRFAIFDVSTEMTQRKDWFAAINKEMEGDGMAAMLYFLQNLDLKDWHPRNNVPYNQALADQRVQSLRGLDKVWFDWLYSAESYGDECGCRVRVRTAVLAKIAGSSTKAAGDYLREMGCEHDRNSRPTGWVTPPLAEARKIWDDKRFKVDWNDIVHWLSMPTPPDEDDF